jgi:uncharacterized protein YxjI
VPDYRIATELSLVAFRAELSGPGGPVGCMEARLALQGPDFLVRDPAGALVLEAKQPQAFTLFRRVLYEVSRNGSLAARIHESFMSFVNPRFRVEVPGEEPWLVWFDFLAGEYAFTRRGREFARLRRAGTTRSWNRATEERVMSVEEGEDALLLLTLGALLARRS